MLNLRDQLVKAGVVSEAAAKNAEKKTSHPKKSRRPAAAGENEHVRKLRGCSKGEQYQKIAKWVRLNRLDKGVNLAEAEKFYFKAEKDTASWLTIEKSTIEAIRAGKAVVMAFMSNQGLAHAVMPADIARDVGAVFPEWIRR